MARLNFRESCVVQGNEFFSPRLVGSIGVSLLLHGGLGLLLIVLGSASTEELKPKEKRVEVIDVVVWEGDRPQLSPVPTQGAISPPTPTSNASSKPAPSPIPRAVTSKSKSAIPGRSPQSSPATPSPRLNPNPTPAPKSSPNPAPATPNPAPASPPPSQPPAPQTRSTTPPSTPPSAPVSAPAPKPSAPPAPAPLPAPIPQPSPPPPAAPAPKPPAPAPKPKPIEPLRCISGCSLQKSSIQGLSGTTVIQFQVTPAGQVTSVGIANSSGHASLDQTAIAAARNMRFNARQGVVNNQFHRVNVHFGS